jgi:hypothetical protein
MKGGLRDVPVAHALQALLFSLFQHHAHALTNVFSMQCTPSQVAGWMSKKEMRAYLEAQFPHKSEAQVQELCDALDMDDPSNMFRYTDLFEEDEVRR